MQRTEPMTLREAAQRTALSITTLRRYVRSGRLRAGKRQGRFGPEYCLSEGDLSQAGLAATPVESRPARGERSGTRIALAALDVHATERLLREAVPLALFQELQMKHEQLLVQYGMMRAGGLRMLDLQGQLDARGDQLRENQAQAGRMREQLVQQATRLQQAELELEGRRLEIAALREKVRALEMLTRNAARSQDIDQQFSEIMTQSRRVERLASRLEPEADEPGLRAPAPADEREH